MTGHTPDETGRRPANRLPISPWTVGDLLEPDETDDEPLPTLDRPSSLRGKRIGRRRD